MASSVDVLRGLVLPVPEPVARRAEAWVPGSRSVAPEVAASVLLLRDGPAGLETYLLHRHARMPFAASMVVFPGGRLDPVDQQAPDPVRACAVRETAEETGVRLRPADLRDWAHWTTPEVEPRRYATRFFVAGLPAGQSAQDLSGETDRAEWTVPAEALAAAARGEIALMPPTFTLLRELAAAPSVAAVLAAAEGRVVVPVMPQVVRTPTGWVFRYPEAG